MEKLFHVNRQKFLRVLAIHRNPLSQQCEIEVTALTTPAIRSMFMAKGNLFVKLLRRLPNRIYDYRWR